MSDWDCDDDDSVGGSIRISKRPRLDAISEEEDSSGHSSCARSSEQSLLVPASAANPKPVYPFSFAMNAAGEVTRNATPANPPQFTITIPPRASTSSNQTDQHLDDNEDDEDNEDEDEEEDEDDDNGEPLDNGGRDRGGSVDSLFHWVHGGNPPV